MYILRINKNMILYDRASACHSKANVCTRRTAPAISVLTSSRWKKDYSSRREKINSFWLSNNVRLDATWTANDRVLTRARFLRWRKARSPSHLAHCCRFCHISREGRYFAGDENSERHVYSQELMVRPNLLNFILESRTIVQHTTSFSLSCLAHGQDSSPGLRVCQHVFRYRLSVRGNKNSKLNKSDWISKLNRSHGVDSAKTHGIVDVA